MNKTIKQVIPFMLTVMFIHTGCAKQEVVRKDGALPLSGSKQVANTQQKPLATTVVNTPSVKSDETKKSGHASESLVTTDMKKALEQIYFDFDSSTLSDSARKALDRNFALLKQNPQARVRVEGHCDERGSDEYNLALGERRARAAARYLTILGVSSERLSLISYGEEKPEVSGHDETSWARNRRDEFVISR